MNKFDKDNITGVAALLVHAAKIDENYTEKEKSIILKVIKMNGTWIIKNLRYENFKNFIYFFSFFL